MILILYLLPRVYPLICTAGRASERGHPQYICDTVGKHRRAPINNQAQRDKVVIVLHCKELSKV